MLFPPSIEWGAEGRERRGGEDKETSHLQLLLSLVPQWIHNEFPKHDGTHTLISFISAVIYGTTIGAQPCARCGRNKQEQAVIVTFLGAGSSEVETVQ